MVPKLLIIISFTTTLVAGYSLNANNISELIGSEGSAGLFGWSMAHMGSSLYIGAPLSGPAGKVYKCQNLKDVPTCQELRTPAALLENSWYGGSLTASKASDILFNCAFGYKWKVNKTVESNIGQCFKMKVGSESFEDWFNFTRYDSGDTELYGVSSTVLNDELVIGSYRYQDIQGSIGIIRSEDAIEFLDETDWKRKKYAGYSLTTGQFFRVGGEKLDPSLVVGAPKDGNYKGKVYICHKCFENKPEYSEVHGTKAGEHFGSSLAACDLNGDGHDDLVVGAPHYARHRFIYNSGRVHVFLWNSDRKQLERMSPKSASYLTAPVQTRDAKFGSSVVCLGNTDSGNTKEVMVGAPYYEGAGAVFVYRYNSQENKLELSQTIKSPSGPGIPSTGFGWKLSDPLQVTDSHGKTLTQGIAVGGPQHNRAYYIRARAVPSLNDNNANNINIIVQPTIIDPYTTKVVTVRVVPLIVDVQVKLKVKAIVTTDSRLELVNSNDNQIYDPDIQQSPHLTFEFRRNTTDSNSNCGSDCRPVDFRITVEFVLFDCKDSYTDPCPIFTIDSDPIYVRSEDGQRLTMTMERKRSNFNVCKDKGTGGCKCRLEFSENQDIQIVSGEVKTISLGDLKNVGSEASPSTTFSISLDKELKRKFWFRRLDGCEDDSDGKTINCTFYLGSNTSQPLRISPIETISHHVKNITFTISVQASCNGNSKEIVREIVIHVEQRWSLNLTERDHLEEISWSEVAENNEGVKPIPVSLDYQVASQGPSSSPDTIIHVFLSTDPLILHPGVTLERGICSEINPIDVQIPRLTTLSEDTADYRDITCTNKEDCIVFECNVQPIEKLKRKDLQINFEFNKEVATKEDVGRLVVLTHLEVKNVNQSIIQRLTSRIMFEYDQGTLGVLVSHWQYIVAVVGAILACVIVGLGVWKMGLFQTVRLFKDEDGDDRGNLSLSSFTIEEE